MRRIPWPSILMLVVGLSLICIDHQPAIAQEHPARIDEDSSLYAARNSVPLLLRILLPPGVREGYSLRAYLAGDDFQRSTGAESDRERMDDILFDAEELAHGIRPIALVAAAFGVFEHRYVPVQLPGFVLSIPLTSESADRFERRVGHLPQHLYSPRINDVDKLQHFFSSAWLKSVLGMDWLVGLAGNLVEVGEQAFLVGGSNDPRDKHANRDGLRFGAGVGNTDYDGELEIAPSSYLTPNP